MSEHASAPPSGLEFPRQYLAADADFGIWDAVEKCYRDLVDRAVGTREELEVWLCQVSELEAGIDEERAKRHVDATCHTEDEGKQHHYLWFIHNIEARCQPWRDRILRRYLEHAERIPLPPQRYEVLTRRARNTVELYRDENVPLLTEETRLANEYQRIAGAMTCQYDGREQTLQQMARYLEESDRQVRERTWHLAADRFHEDARRLDELFEQMVSLRHKIGVQADCGDYRNYMFKRYGRFDYSIEDCLAFHDAIERVVVPAVQQLAAERRNRLGLASLRPWDFAVSPDGEPPLRPFENDAQLSYGCAQIFRRVHPELGRVFDALREQKLLDLSSRRGKAPGGYQETFHERRVPFIFMNAVGTAHDVRTLLHEGGHAFHTWACRHEPLLAYRTCESIIEFAELAAMGMECLALPHTHLFFGDQTPRATRQFFERIVQFFPFMARIDAFQHYVYTHVGEGLERWKDYWQGLTRRFAPEIDYSGLETYDRQSWQQKLHVYQVPFYYVEYGIAQVGALQLWLSSRKDYEQAVAAYRQGLALGASRPLPELFAAAGCKFDFSERTLRPLIDAVMEEIARLGT